MKKAEWTISLAIGVCVSMLSMKLRAEATDIDQYNQYVSYQQSSIAPESVAIVGSEDYQTPDEGAYLYFDNSPTFIEVGFGNNNPIEGVADVKQGLELEIIDIVVDLKKRTDYLKDLGAMIKTICDKATIDKNGFVLIPDDLKGTKTTIGCNCLKSLANSQNYWRLIGHEFKLKPVNPGLDTPYTGYAEEEDRINGIGKFIPLKPGVFGPITPGVPLSKGIVVVSLSGSEVDFGFIDRWGRPHIYPLWRILAHELCGHAVFFNKGMEVNPPGPQFSDKPGKRPHHDQAIKAENAIISEHPGQIKRGLWADFPNKPVTGTNAGGESFIVPKLTPRIK